MSAPATDSVGATAVITHRVRRGREAAYEQLIEALGPQYRAYPGHLDWHIIRPVPGLTSTYTIVIRFDTTAHLRGWLESPERALFLEHARPLLAADDDFTIRTGLDFWFAPQDAGVRVPVRWKQFLITWSAIYPVALVVPVAVGWCFRRLRLPPNHYLLVLVTAALVVYLMAYVIMPRYTRLVRRWLYR